MAAALYWDEATGVERVHSVNVTGGGFAGPRGLRVGMSVQEAAADADIVYTDVWASMGQEEEKAKREKAFAGYQVNDAAMAAAKPDAMAAEWHIGHEKGRLALQYGPFQLAKRQISQCKTACFANHWLSAC